MFFHIVTGTTREERCSYYVNATSENDAIVAMVATGVPMTEGSYLIQEEPSSDEMIEMCPSEGDVVVI